MKRSAVIIFAIALLSTAVFAKGKAEDRAAAMGPGMNLSFMENYWQGDKEKHYSDFLRAEDFAAARQRLKDIYAAGFRTVRIPINFSAWSSMEAPYGWESEELPEKADKLIGLALDAGLKVIIDHHHPELNEEQFPEAASTPRMKVIWERIAKRYRHLDPEKVFFELRNEPKNIEADVWRAQALVLIRTVREIAPEHTLIVGFHDWNSRDALIASKPFEDGNIIYTFHYYHPFMFTHQGATWVAPGISDLKEIPFPGVSKLKLGVPEKGKGTWVEQQLNSYPGDANGAFIDAQLREAKDWADQHGVPIFLGEFGSLSTHSKEEDRCRHAAAVYSALGKYRIPSAWWEWFAGFNFLDEKGRKPRPCFADVISRYSAALTAGGPDK